MSRYRDAFEQHKVISAQFLKGVKVDDLCIRYGLQARDIKTLILLDITEEQYAEQCGKNMYNSVKKREAARHKK